MGDQILSNLTKGRLYAVVLWHRAATIRLVDGIKLTESDYSLWHLRMFNVNYFEGFIVCHLIRGLYPFTSSHLAEGVFGLIIITFIRWKTG